MNLPPIVSKICYAILLSPLQAKQTTFARSDSTLYPYKSRYKRAISVVSLVDRVIPRASDRLSRLMYKNNRFPWSAVDIDLAAFGSGTAVFKVNGEGDDKALRIYRKSLGKSLRGVLEIARYYKRNYETVLSWYGGSVGLVLPMDFLVLCGPPFSNPVAASLQPYIHGHKQDPFNDFSDDELVGLLQRNETIREQFIYFARQTTGQWQGQKTCFDLLGNQNLMLVNQGGNYRLCIADVGIFDFDVIAKQYPEKREKIKHRMDRLASLYEMAKGI
ncbi:MAG: hypothetical protein ABI621_08965 [Chloroflexota bacterium]